MTYTTCPECGQLTCRTLLGVTDCESCEYFRREDVTATPPAPVVITCVSDGEPASVS